MASSRFLSIVGLALCGCQAGAAPAGPEPAREPRHIALMIGIADYQSFAPGGPPGRSDLRGPLNDVELVRATLRSRLFDSAEDIRILTDSAGSKAGIAAGFEWLIQRATHPSDVVVVFYSGHGSTAPDRNGDEAHVTPGDLTDEALVPWDASDIHQADQLILDDAVGGWLERLNTRNVTVIVDACFSGTATRGEDDGTPRGPSGLGDDSLLPGGSTFRNGNRYTTITASKADEVALEKPFGPDGQVYGVLTWFLAQAIRGSGPTARYDELFQRLVPTVRGRSNQTPQLEGDRNSLLLSEKHRVPSRAFVRATPESGGRFRIDEGAIHGVRKSAVYDLYPDGELDFQAGSQGQVVIDSVDLLVSFARSSENRPDPGRPLRAVLARLPRGARLVDHIEVYVHPDASGAIPLVEGTPGVVLTTERRARVQVRSLLGANRVFLDDGLIPPLDPGDPRLCGPLARALAIVSLEQIRNPEPPRDLRIMVRVLPAGQAPGNLSPAVDTVAVNQVVSIWVKVIAPSSSTLYLSMATMGYSSPTSMLFESGEDGRGGDQGRIQPMELNRWIRVVPEIPVTEPVGPEVLKVLVDSDQYSLQRVVNGFGCETRRGDPPLEDPPAPLAGWDTVEHRIMILPPAHRVSP